MPASASTASKAVVNCPARSRDQDLELSNPVTEVDEQLQTELVGDIVVDCDTFIGGPGDQTIVMITAIPDSEDEQKLDLLRVIGLQQPQRRQG
jgi:hypothetical protein